MARVVNCPCGHALNGMNDDELFELAKRHLKLHHPDSNRTEDEIRELVKQMAKDA